MLRNLIVKDTIDGRHEKAYETYYLVYRYRPSSSFVFPIDTLTPAQGVKRLLVKLLLLTSRPPTHAFGVPWLAKLLLLLCGSTSGTLWSTSLFLLIGFWFCCFVFIFFFYLGTILPFCLLVFLLLSLLLLLATSSDVLAPFVLLDLVIILFLLFLLLILVLLLILILMLTLSLPTPPPPPPLPFFTSFSSLTLLTTSLPERSI